MAASQLVIKEEPITDSESEEMVPMPPEYPVELWIKREMPEMVLKKFKTMLKQRNLEIVFKKPRVKRLQKKHE